MNLCTNCKIRVGCDILSVMCRLSAVDVPRLRPDLVRNVRRSQQLAWAENAAKATAQRKKLFALGWKKYDGRINGQGHKKRLSASQGQS